MDIRLVEIDESGIPVEEIPLSDVARSVCESYVTLFQKVGFQRPWIGYLGISGGRVVGTCAFKSPPQKGQVEIAYFTFPGYEGQGIATRMAQQLVSISQKADDSIAITAQTLPHENSSTSILRKLNFCQIGIAHDEDVGEVWEWKMNRDRNRR